MYVCIHLNASVYPGETLVGTDCQQFARPTQLPESAVLLAINMGASQVTLSIWDVGDFRLNISDHTSDWLDMNRSTGKVSSCAIWPRPSEISSHSVLASVNSGANQDTESFWNNTDGTVSQCIPKKNVSGFLGMGPRSFGPVISCSIMQMALF